MSRQQSFHNLVIIITLDILMMAMINDHPDQCRGYDHHEHPCDGYHRDHHCKGGVYEKTIPMVVRMVREKKQDWM